MQPRLLDLHEVAQILHLSRSYTYLLIRRGDIVAVKFGTAVRVHPDDLERYIATKRLLHAANVQEFLKRHRHPS